MTKIRTRFAPSPTGSMHIGGLRTALYAYALAKHSHGDFILRIEDTDKEREVAGSTGALQKTLKKFGLIWDECHVQSQRLELYKKAAEKLVKSGHAYRDEGAIRIKIPKNQHVSFYDFALRKEVSWKTDILEDLVLLKSDGFPTYHLAVVVDDHEMGITHVLRGHDWLPSTPLHLLIYKALNYKVPNIGHLTDIQDPEGGKLSKRKGSVSVEGMLSEGYLPEALLNFVILLGWAPKDNRELFTLDEFVKTFDVKGFQKSNPVFNKDKLDWFNGQYIRKLSDDELIKIFEERNPKFAALKNDKKTAITKLVKERIKTLNEFDTLAGFFFKRPKVDKKLLGKNYQKHLEVAINVPPTRWASIIKEKGFKTGDFFMDLRIAVTGSKFTPPINESIEILGKEETMTRLRHAISNF